MASIKSLEMAGALSSLSCITVKKSLFGQKAVYETTQSPLDVKVLEYAPAEGERLERLLKLPLGNLVAEIQANGKPAATAVGHHRMELCVSRDHQFLAMQLFHFVDFKYTPAFDLKTYEGKDVELILQLF